MIEFSVEMKATSRPLFAVFSQNIYYREYKHCDPPPSLSYTKVNPFLSRATALRSAAELWAHFVPSAGVSH